MAYLCKSLIPLGVLTLALQVSACSPSQGDERDMAASLGNPQSGDAVGRTDDSTSTEGAKDPSLSLAKYLTVSYKEDLTPLLQSYCTTQCHNATALDSGPVFDTYDTAMKLAQEMQDAIDNQEMPPDAKAGISQEAKDDLKLISTLLTQWRKDNYLNTYATLQVSYTRLLAPMAGELCLSCHTASSSFAEPDLNTLASWEGHVTHIEDEVRNQRMPPGINSNESKRLFNLIEQWEKLSFPF